MRRRLVAALAAGLALATAGCWPVPGQNADRTSANTAESRIDAANVAGLVEAWRSVPVADAFHPWHGPVVARSGVIATMSCAVAAMDPATGIDRWVGWIDGDDGHCLWPFVEVTGEPYVLTLPGGRELVLANHYTRRDIGHGQAEETFSSSAIDGATGYRVRNIGAPIAAVRGTAMVTSSNRGDGAGGSGMHLTVEDLAGGPGASYRLYPTPAPGHTPTPERVTLGARLLFHAGTGPLSIAADGTITPGTGVRAFSRDVPAGGCGPGDCLAWALPIEGGPSTPVLGANGTRLYTRTATTVYAVDAGTGTVLWTAGGLTGSAAPALAGGVLYVPTGDGRVATLPAAGCGAATCTPGWLADTGTGQELATPTIGGDVLYVAAGGSVRAYPAAGCGAAACTTPLWSGEGDTPPTVANGRIYTTTEREVVAYRLP